MKNYIYALPPNHWMIAPSFLERQVNLFSKLTNKIMRTHEVIYVSKVQIQEVKKGT
jgi:hypothetical protein